MIARRPMLIVVALLGATQIVGYGDSVGAVQAGHHHHVAGIGTDADGRRHDGAHHHHHYYRGEAE